MGEFEDHYNSDLSRALDAYNERKRAALTDGQAGTVVADLDALRRAFSGYDLDLDELMEIKAMIGLQGLEAVVRGVPPVEVVGGGWVDGLVTGIILERKRSE